MADSTEHPHGDDGNHPKDHNKAPEGEIGEQIQAAIEKIDPNRATIKRAKEWMKPNVKVGDDNIDDIEKCIKEVGSVKSAATKAKEEHTKPLHQAWKEMNDAWKAPIDWIAKLQADLKAKVQPFKEAKLKAAEEAARKAEEAARKAEAETKAAAEREAEQTATGGDSDPFADAEAEAPAQSKEDAAKAEMEAKAAKEAAEKAQKEARKGTQTIEVAVVAEGGRKEVLQFMLSNERCRPALQEFVDEFVRANAVKLKREGIVMPGVEFKKETRIRAQS